jgi:NADPH2:quinone reductase
MADTDRLGSRTRTMLAGVASENGLELREVARPVPSPGQVLVRVAAAGLNRADLNAARGAGVASKDSFGKPIGMEWAGTVEDVGRDVADFALGDRVMCSGSGGYAEYAVTDSGRTLKLPEGFDLAEAAVLPLALLTAHDAVVTNGRLREGEAVLVQGASSAVGLMTLQLARLKGARIIAGSSTLANRRARLREFGATHVVDPAQSSWAEELIEATGGKGVDLVVDMIAGASVNLSMKAAAVRGRMINVGRLGGAKADFDFDLHAAKRLDYIGVTFRTRTIAEVREIVARMHADLWDGVRSRRLFLPIDSRFSLADAAAAHKRMAANAHFGKIVLNP